MVQPPPHSVQLKINIFCNDQESTHRRFAEELRNRLGWHHVLVNESGADADINYFISFKKYREKSGAIDTGWFPHFPQQHDLLWMRAAQELDHCIAPSERAKDNLILSSIPEEKVSVVAYCGESGLAPKVRLGVVGRTYGDGRKGEHLVRQLLEDDEIDAMLSIVAKGDGWDVPVSDLEYLDFYNSIDFLLVPSLLEAGPVPFLEALGCGKKSIAPPIGNVPEFEHIEYKAGDLGDLKRTILEVCLPVFEERRKLSSQVEENCWDYFAAAHDKIFRKLYARSLRGQEVAGTDSTLEDVRREMGRMEEKIWLMEASLDRMRNSLLYRIYKRTVQPLRALFKGG